MKLLLKYAGLAALVCTAAWGQVTTNATVSIDGTAFDGGGIAAPDNVTLLLDGTADAGVARTENTIWQPDGTPDVLGNLPLGATTYTPKQGAGQYWLQFRLVDANNNYQDQWISFTVQPGYLVPNGSVGAQMDDGSFTLTQDGQASNGIAWTENVIWQPDGTYQNFGRQPLGQLMFQPTGGSGTYWYQCRVVDANYNYRDQWISFTVP